MTAAEFENVVPGLVEARKREKANRAYAFAGLNHTVCGFEVRPYTPRHRLTLELLGNAFDDFGAPSTLADVFVFLWVLSPKNRGTDIESRRQEYFLRQDVLKLDPDFSRYEIYQYLFSQMQDLQDGRTRKDVDKSAWIHWAAFGATFWCSVHGGFTMDQYLDTPFLVLQQLSRAWRVNHPEYHYGKQGNVLTVDPLFKNASDLLEKKWREQFEESIRAHFNAPVFRKN